MFSDSEHLPILLVDAEELTDATVACSSYIFLQRGGTHLWESDSHKPSRSGVKLCPGLTEATVRKRDQSTIGPNIFHVHGMLKQYTLLFGYLHRRLYKHFWFHDLF